MSGDIVREAEFGNAARLGHIARGVSDRRASYWSLCSTAESEVMAPVAEFGRSPHRYRCDFIPSFFDTAR